MNRIFPSVDGSKSPRLRRFLRRNLVFFGAGVVLTSLSLGALLAFAGARLQLQGMIHYLTVILIGFLFIRVLLGRIPRPLCSTWQVPKHWDRFGPGPYSLLFGCCLGMGFLTVVVAVEFYFVLLLSAGAASVWMGVAVMGAFGLGRVAPYVLQVSRSARGEVAGSDVLSRGLTLRPVLSTLRLLLLAILLGGGPAL